MNTSKETEKRMYNLVDESGGGILMPWVKYGLKTKDFSILEEFCDTMVKYFMYNDGSGKFVPVSELVMIRNKQRNAILSMLRRKKGKGTVGPNILEEVDQSAQIKGDLSKALKILDGFVSNNRNIKYRMIVWDLAENGKMGENLLHLCLLHNTAEHNTLAKHLIVKFPKLVNDIFISEEYYGLAPIHQAIVNEDVQMLYYLLRNKADVHQRCYGSFFCAEDQKDTRTDSLKHEWVDMQPHTRYTGRMYWGEYPLSFAACTGQPDCFRLLCVFKADPNLRDTNGNTTLHMCVIHSLPDMFKLAHSLGAKLHIQNGQGLTPLGLAAKLAKKDMFDVIVNIEKQVLWTCRDTVCTAYPLKGIDTVDELTGHLNQSSVLSLVAYGDENEHLDFFDNLLDDLLQKKWKAFGRRKLVQSIIGYTIYLISFYFAFLNRSPTAPLIKVHTENSSSSIVFNGSLSAFGALFTTKFFSINNYLQNDGRCFLWSYTDGPNSFSQRKSVTVDINVGGGRRAVKFVGPFILMVYKIIMDDMIRFLLIYSIFIISFSQAFVLIFKSCERDSGPDFENVFNSPSEALLRMFIMSVGEFGAVYKNIQNCNSIMGVQGKIFFFIYELLVTVMLLNLLIAMMTRTYERIAETQKEWKRQWAQVILMLERSLPPSERLQILIAYSRPCNTDKTQRALVVRQKKDVIDKIKQM
uniref:Ion_trans domain-containing protein n=1 Tax=Panagrellus redivivus TaxID=6233 RepID=A0A7E4VKI6_PANRE